MRRQQNQSNIQVTKHKKQLDKRKESATLMNKKYSINKRSKSKQNTTIADRKA